MIILKLYKVPSVSGSNTPSERGVAALLTIVIVAAATLIMAYSASLLGLGELDLGYTAQKGEEAFSVADGCIEEALHRMRLNAGYTGGSLSLTNGSCTITVSGSNPYTIGAIGTSGDYNKKLEAVITLTGNVITVDSWKEKDD